MRIYFNPLTSHSALLAALGAVAVIFTTGCANEFAPYPYGTYGAAKAKPPTYYQADNNAFVEQAKRAITQLTEGLDFQAIDQDPVLVATLVDINELKQTSTLGRTLGEIYASQLANRGLNVKEMKLRGDVYILEDSGELLLSREIQEIANHHNAALVLVGTYSVAARYTYVSLKLVRTADSRIIRSHDYALPNDQDVMRLLAH